MSNEVESKDGEQGYEIGSIEDLMKIANGDLVEEAPKENPEDEKPEGEASVEAPAEQAPEGEQESAQEAEQYVPDFSYSVKGDSKAFDERLHGVIKTKEDEDFIRELVTKAEGLDSYKEKFTLEVESKKTLEETLADVNDKLAKTSGFYQDIVERRDAGDHRSVLRDIGYDEDTVLKLALDIARERELPQTEQEAARVARQTAEQNRMLLANQQMLQQQIQQVNEQATVSESDALAQQQTAELTGFIQGEYAELNSAMEGNGLNIMDEAISVGHSLYLKNGNVEPSTADVMKAVADKFKFMTAQQEQAQPAPKRKAIPTVGGGNASTVGEAPASIEELQKIYEQRSRANY